MFNTDDSDDDDLEDSDDEDMDDSEECDDVGESGKRRYSEYNYNGVRGSRTNCKGHWSKEEVRILIEIKAHLLFFLINLNAEFHNLSPFHRISILPTLSESMVAKIGRK